MFAIYCVEYTTGKQSHVTKYCFIDIVELCLFLNMPELFTTEF